MGSRCSCGEFPATRAEVLSRVLVIDEEPLVRWSLVAGLRHAGFDAVAAGTPENAIRLAGERPLPDVVLLDLGLWGADPLRLLEDIRQRAPRSRILLLAVAGDDIALSICDDLEVIRKPFDLHAVVDRVKSVLLCSAHGARLPL